MQDIWFEKVSYEQWLKDNNYPDENFYFYMYDKIELPQRSTKNSAGYDFCIPNTTVFLEGEPNVIKTGIRAHMPENVVLLLFPRSGLGFKYGMRLYNTTGVIDSDYYNALNEGHIQAKVCFEKGTILESGDRFMQGVFVTYLTAENEERQELKQRTGGFGSTDQMTL